MAKKTKEKKRERRERRFLPLSTSSPLLVKVLGAVGAAAMGAGAWGQFGRPATPALEPMAYAWWILAAGAMLLGIAVWLGTSGEPALRVGDGGIAVEKGGLVRMAWRDVSSIGWDDVAKALIIAGKDEPGAELSVRVLLKSQPQAVARILKEATVRIKEQVDVSEEARELIPRADNDAGEVILLEPLQVVGKRCADSDKVIAYEPDGRVCPRCERVYHKAHVPSACTCGASLEALTARPAADLETESAPA